jgi:hypothetical protein
MSDEKKYKNKTMILSVFKLVLLSYSFYVYFQNDFAKAAYFLLIILVLTDAYEVKR